MMSMQVRLYGRLLRSTKMLQKQFNGLGGTRDMEELDRLLLRVALRPTKKMSAPRGLIDEVQETLRGGDSGLADRVRREFRGEGPFDAKKAFAHLRFSTELRNIIAGARQEVQRSALITFNVGQIVWHEKQDLLGVVYSYDTICDESYLSERQKRCANLSGTWCHFVCLDGSFRYAPERDLAPKRAFAVQFLEALRASPHHASEAGRFVDGLLFTGITSDRFVANSDLWKRFPDADGRSTPDGLAVIPLNSAAPSSSAGPLTVSVEPAADTPTQPSLSRYLASLFFTDSGKKKAA